MDNEERLAMFLDYENLAIGARDRLSQRFDLSPVAEAMAERGRVVVRKAYADWSMFDKDRRMLTRHHVELIEMTQRMGASRKNAADIKLVVDAIELAFERDYISTFVLCTGDSDFTPLVHKLRELDKRVIGVGIQGSTSKILPPSCDEFLFYDRLVDLRSGSAAAGDDDDADSDDATATRAASPGDVTATVVGTLTGLLGAGDSAVRASSLKRAILRKDPTFSEADHGFRSWGELMRSLADEGVVALDGKGDPDVSLPTEGSKEAAAFTLLASVVTKKGVSMSGLKPRLLKKDPDFDERRLGYRGFLQFCKAADARGAIRLTWDEGQKDYVASKA